jgi:hypothetical protein
MTGHPYHHFLNRVAYPAALAVKGTVRFRR